MTAAFSSTVGTVLKGVVAGKSVKTLERAPIGSELAILKVSAVTWGEFRPNESKAMPPDYAPGDCPRAMDGDILISRANTRELVGAPVMVRGNHPQLLLSDKLLKLIPDERVVERRYLVRALRAPAAFQHFAQCAGGTSGSMTNITQDSIRAAPLYLPPLTEQRRIAAILDQADALRAKRREALAQLDSLTQSIFIEMFGDPSECMAIGTGLVLANVVAPERIVTYGIVQAGPELADGVPYIKTGDIKNGIILENQLARTSREIVTAYARSALKPADIVMSIRATVGTTALVPDSLDGANLTQGTARISPAAFMNSLYLLSYLRTGAVQSWIQSQVKGATFREITLGRLRQLPALAPPLALQQTFATRIQAVESLKATHRAALAESDALFASLNQRSCLPLPWGW